MAITINEKLAEALARAGNAALGNIVNSNSISPKERSLLTRHGYLKKIIRSWYLLDADLLAENAGESALWFESIWAFIGQYLGEKFGTDYYLSPEASLDLLTGNNALPNQIIAFTKNSASTNTKVSLPNNMSLLILGTSKEPYQTIYYKNSVYTHSLESALVECAPRIYTSNPVSVQLAIKSSDINKLSEAILTTKNTNSGNRIIGALEALEMKPESRNLETIMKGAGLDISTRLNPFEEVLIPLGGRKGESPSSTRVRTFWNKMRPAVIEVFDDLPPTFEFKKRSIRDTLSMIEELYVSDAYNSLSIEGYQVTPELIKKVAEGDWSPETQSKDKEQKDALAAKGYFDAFNKVKDLINEAYQTEGELDLEYLISVGLTEWYTALFQPCISVGIIQVIDLAGYRKGPIYIRGSKHVPPPSEQLMDCMDALKELINEEEHFIVKAILGHLSLGYIHPFPDGNGRSARFLMNFLLILGGYPWAIVQLRERTQYLSSLESASVDGNITPFSEFIKSSIKVTSTLIV
ncbi:MAG: Fic family protein [Alteromonadaceae bacterium]